jgi:hypothetical protein
MFDAPVSQPIAKAGADGSAEAGSLDIRPRRRLFAKSG